MSIIVREYQENDLDMVNSLLQESFSCEKKPFQSSQFQEVVAEIEGVVVGYLLLTKVFNPILQKNYYLVDYVCVSSSYRRMGVGRELLGYAYQIAKDNQAVYLQLTCSHFRIAAHELYEKCGFVKRESDIYRKEIV